MFVCLFDWFSFFWLRYETCGIFFSPTRLWTGVPCSGSNSVLTPGSPRKSQPHVLVSWLCIQLHRKFIMTPRKGPQWGQKSSCFYKVRHRCLSAFLYVTARLEASGLEIVLIPLPHLCSPYQQEAHLLPETNHQHWSPFMQCHAFLLLFTCPAPPDRGSETLHLGPGMNILACSAFQTLVANIVLILTARSDPAKLLARTCCECCPMKSLIWER